MFKFLQCPICDIIFCREDIILLLKKNPQNFLTSVSCAFFFFFKTLYNWFVSCQFESSLIKTGQQTVRGLHLSSLDIRSTEWIMFDRTVMMMDLKSKSVFLSDRPSHSVISVWKSAQANPSVFFKILWLRTSGSLSTILQHMWTF